MFRRELKDRGLENYIFGGDRLIKWRSFGFDVAHCFGAWGGFFNLVVVINRSEDLKFFYSDCDHSMSNMFIND